MNNYHPSAQWRIAGLLIVSALVIGGGVLSLLRYLTTHIAMLPMVVVIIFIFVMTIILTIFFLGRKIDPFHPLLIGSATFALAYLWPFLSIQSSGSFLLTTQGYGHLFTDSIQTAQALTMALIGYLSYITGFLLVKQRNTKHTQPRKISLIRVSQLIAIYIVIGLSLWLLLLYSSGGLAGFVNQFADRLNNLSGRYYLTMGANFLVLATVMWFSIRLTTKQNHYTGLFILLVLITFITLILNGGSRTPLLVSILMLVSTKHYTQKPLSFRSIFLVLIMLSVLYVGYGLLFREYLIIGKVVNDPYSTGANTLFERFISRLMAGSAINLQTLMIMMDGIPDQLDYQHGKTMLALLLSPIPRIWFPLKPISPAGIFSANFLPTMWERGTSVPPSLLGEFYMNWGSIGVIIGMMFFGLFYGSMYQTFIIKKKSTIDVIGYAIVVGLFYPWIRGETLGPTIHFLVLFIPFRIALWWGYPNFITRKYTVRHQSIRSTTFSSNLTKEG